MHMIDYYVIFHVEFVRKQVYIIAIGFMYIYTIKFIVTPPSRGLWSDLR